MSAVRYLILTGEPGVGKTTIIKKLSTLICEKGTQVEGFYTEESRRGGMREGFDVVSIDGALRGRLARDATLLEQRVKCKVGKYGVLVEEFENIAIPILSKFLTGGSGLVVIDEIGKMELFSEPFKSKIHEIFSPKADFIVVATIPVRKSDPIVESIRNNRSSKVFEVRRDNRNTIHLDIFKELETILRTK